MNSRTVIGVVGTVVILALGLWLIGPPRGRIEEEGPQGTLAFRHLVRELGLGGGEADAPDDEGTFVLLTDLRTEPAAAELLGWVENGGRLVVADPSSAVLDELDLEPGGLVGGGVTGSSQLRTDCVVPELTGVGAVATRVTDRRLALPERDLVGCLSEGRDAYLAVIPHGRGRVLALGGRSALTNELLTNADNARFATQLLGPGPVVFGTPRPSGAEAVGAWSAIPPTAKAVLLGLLLVGAAFAFIRGRRLGMPPDETPPSPLPARALIASTAALYRSSGDRAHVAEVLRRGATGRLRRHLGLDAAASRTDLARTLAVHAPIDADHARLVLDGPTPADDRALIALARELDGLRTGRNDP